MDGAPRYGLGVDERTSTLIDLALAEDIGPGDVTSSYFVPEHREARGLILAKSEGVVAGVEVAKEVFKRVDNETSVKILLESGNHVSQGSYVIEVRGKARSLLTAERVALNFLQRLSGVATKTRQFVELTDGTGAKILDTRKTTPGLRLFEKYAVRCGGGSNHRSGLDDAAMLKENHLAWAGGMTAAIDAVRHQAPWPCQVIVEAETGEQACEAVQAGADGVLLDEFSPEQLQVLVPRLRQLAPGGVVLEASGVQPEQLRAFAATGIDLISTSAPMTRSRWLDLSMRFS